MLMSVIPELGITAYAASVKYMETAKDSVQLWNAMGSENNKVGKISTKGTVVKILDTQRKKISLFNYNTWHKVEVASGTTDNGKTGVCWLYDGNVTKHEHRMSKGACSSKGCSYKKDISVKKVCTPNKTMNVTRNGAPVRKEPYNDGEVISELNIGNLVTVTQEVENYKGSAWYKLVSGAYIFSGNVQEATVCEVNKTVSDVNHSGGSGSSGNVNTDHFTIPSSGNTLPCTHSNWSVGKCVGCGKEWELKTEKVSGTFIAKSDDTVAREIPYKQGKEIQKYKKGQKINVDYKAKNSAGHTWYHTKEGYWVYGVEKSTLQSIALSFTSYTFQTENEIAQIKVRITPNHAVNTSKVEWSTSDKSGNIITLDNDGKITAKGSGDAEITCTVTSEEGIVKTATAQIKVDSRVDYMKNLKPWNYSNTEFKEELALECSVYSSLAYPDYTYTYYNNDMIVYSVNGNSKTPDNLTKLLSQNGFNYSIANSYFNKLHTNSPYVLADKVVNYNGDPRSVVYVIIEGSAGRPGWEGNMMITGDTYSAELAKEDHYTFSKSARSLKWGLEEYIEDRGLSKPLVVITGHSRGAAVGNLLARELNKELKEDSSKYEKVYAYLFATPNATTNPVKDKNIYNICNEADLVAYIPLSSEGWNYGKHGQVYSFNTEDLRSDKKDASKSFRNYAETEFQLSQYHRNPDYNWRARSPRSMRDYIEGCWKTVEDYYKYEEHNICGDTSAFDYFYKGLASAAGGGSAAIIIRHLHLLGDGVDKTHKCPFLSISWFLFGNAYEDMLGEISDSFRDSHEMMTYHAAILAKVHNTGNKAHLFSTEESYSNPDVALDENEREALYTFFIQDENQLMIEEAGWDIEDPETWKGIQWNEDGNIVSIDLSYMNLSGWFNANKYPKLKKLNVNGNNLSMLAVSGCSELEDLSCMANSIGSISVSSCSNLQNLDCAFNEISSLDVSEMSQLSELNCYGNEISRLDMTDATALQTVRCGNNELTSIDISTNTSLNTMYCENNNIIESYNTEFVEDMEKINLNGGSAIIGTQKYNENFGFNEEELECLTAFAGMALNSEKLNWNMEEPYTWQGVKWEIVGDEYHITEINFDGLELEGDLNLPEVEYIETVSCEDSSLATLNLAGCSSLNTLNCYNSGISELVIDDCSELDSLSCDDNYLEIEDVESSLSQSGLNTGIASYESQNIAADEESFDSTEREVLIEFLSTANNAEILGWDWDWPGTWEGIVWTKADGVYRVNEIHLADREVSGNLDLSDFIYLENFDFRGTQIETVILPDCVTAIPEYAFYNSDVKHVYMRDGITNIGKSAFSYCDKLNNIVLPATVRKIEDHAFYECINLKNLVFVGDEPLVVGKEIAYGASAKFKITFFEGTKWNQSTTLLSDYIYTENKEPYLIMLDEEIKLKEEGYYHETNNYAGDDISLIIVSKNPGEQAKCLISVYNESGIVDNLSSSVIEMNTYMNAVTFKNVNVQYAGEEYCFLKAFLWSDSKPMRPLTKATELFLEKPISE